MERGAYLLKFFRERTRWKCFSDSHFNGKTTEVTFKNNKDLGIYFFNQCDARIPNENVGP